MENGQNTFVQSNQTNDADAEDDVFAKKKSACYKIIRNRKYQLWTFLILFTVLVPVLMFLFMFERKISYAEESFTCQTSEAFRVPCGEVNITLARCQDMDCCFDREILQCYHFLPSKYRYKLNGDGTYSATQGRSPLRTATSPTLKLGVVELDANRVQIIVHDIDASYEETTIDEKNYTVVRSNRTLELDVTRSDGQRLLTTGLGPLIASEGYWEWTFFMSTDLFGFEELYFENNDTSISRVFYKNGNDSVSLPAFMAHTDGSYVGLVVETDGPMEIEVLPSKLIVMRSLVGGVVSLTVAVGPTPLEVTSQLRNFNFETPAQWVLEPHICRGGATDLISAIDEYLEFAEGENTVQYASDCFHEDLYFMLYSANETARRNLTDALAQLREKTRLMVTIAPQILIGDDYQLFRDASERDLLYYNATGGLYNGTYANQQVAYPDFASPSIGAWLDGMLELFDLTDAHGFVLSDNYPTEDTFEMEIVDHFPYMTEDIVSSMSFTLPWNVTTPVTNVTHYKIHNSYSHGQAEYFKNLVTNPVVFTTSYSYGMDAVVQPRNLNATWTNLRRWIKITLSHSLFAHPLSAFPVCGSSSHFNATTQEVLCMRWYITAATMPMFKISSEFPSRDPHSLTSGHAVNVAMDAIKKRNMFVPYYRTVLGKQEPITRPTFFDFYEDTETFALNEQYMVGDSLLAAQLLLSNKFTLDVYLPPAAGAWYEFFGGAKYQEDLGWISLPVVDTDWIMFIRQGKIVPLKNSIAVGSGVEETYTLAVALDDEDKATGTLLLDTTVLRFEAITMGVRISNITSGRVDMGCGESERKFPSVVEKFMIYGLNNETLTWSNFTAVDLCDVQGDEEYITYFSSQILMDA